MGALRRRMRRLAARFKPSRLRASLEDGTTYIEIALTAVIVTISLLAMSNAIINAGKGPTIFKEKSRALSLAQDRVDEVKRMGFDALTTRYSKYQWPTVPDPEAPLSQALSAPVYPSPAPDAGLDPWLPETILSGGIVYWRHVTVKCVEELDGVLKQKPDPADAPPGGVDPSTNLMRVEVDVTWFSRVLKGMRHVRVVTMVANPKVPVSAEGRISGTVFNEGPTAGPGDDTPITCAKMVVYASNPATGDSYSVAVKADGRYELSHLPVGEYLVKLSGAPAYYDSAHSAAGDPVPPAAASTVTLTTMDKEKASVGIWTRPARRVRIIGGFIGAAESEQVTVTSSDGLSKPQTIIPSKNCVPGDECFFEVPDVGWPTVGIKTIKLTVANVPKGTYDEATICMDSAKVGTATDFYFGPPPPLYTPTPCGACPNPCQSSSLYLNAGGKTDIGAKIRVKVKEYFSGSKSDLAGALVCVNDGNSGTQMTGADGYQTATGYIAGVKPAQTGLLTVRAWMGTTGYSTDVWRLDFDVQPGISYNLEEEQEWSETLLPPLLLRHTFVLKRVSDISGTVYKTCASGAPPCGFGSEPMKGVVVRIANPNTGFGTAVTTDDYGHFTFTGVPVEATNLYKVTPSGGGDLQSNPPESSVKVAVNGLVYVKDNSGQPLEFVVTLMNGYITGKVLKGGLPYDKGAIVFATTYAGTFPSTLPNSVLSGYRAYSTITETDGSYTVKVATGVGNYRIHVFSPDNPAAPFTVDVTAGQPASGTTVTAPVVVIP